jgi:molecular chaperone DnaK
VHKLFNEPTAAALAYGIQQNKDDHLMVFDFGGGTLDITLLEVKKGAFIVRGVGGDSELGGVDFDRVIVDHVRDDFEKTNSVDLSKDPVAYQQLQNHAERCKIDLSGVNETKVMIPYVTVSKKRPTSCKHGINTRNL